MRLPAKVAVSRYFATFEDIVAKEKSDYFHGIF